MNKNGYFQFSICQLPAESPLCFCLSIDKCRPEEIKEAYQGAKIVWEETVNEPFRETATSQEYNSLDEIYIRFNNPVQIPSEYTGRSLSISDVIRIQKFDGDGSDLGVTYYLCTRLGWERLSL